MPPISFWFTGSAIGACIALIVAMTSLGWAWYNAALTEQKSAQSSARSKDVRGQLQALRSRCSATRSAATQRSFTSGF